MNTVTMPNGLEVTGVPDGTTKAVLIDRLLTQGQITQQQAQEWGKGIPEGSLPGPEEDQTPIADSLSRLPESLRTGAPRGATVEGGEAALDAIAGNMDIPAGMAGAVAGAQAGSLGGPVGAVVGGVLGGAGGTFGGSLLSDYLTEDEMDMSSATQEALISAGFDALTLGAAKTFKGAAKALGFGPEEMAELWKKYNTPKAPTDPQAFPVGSPESLKQTQDFLESNKGSLTAYQTGQASASTNLMEGIGQIGVLSGSKYKQQSEVNAQAVAKAVNALMDESAANIPAGNIGESVHGVIQGGRKAAQSLYNDGVGEITQRVGTRQINPKWVTGTIQKFLKENKKEWGYDLDKGTLALVDEWNKSLGDLTSMSVSDLLALQKRFNTQVTQLGEFGQTQNTVASRELAQLSSRIRQTTQVLLENVDPASAKVYRELNTAYGEAMEGLLPKLNANIVARADKGDYESIARALEGKNPDQIEAFMKSIDTAYIQAGMAGVDMAEVARFATPEQARQAIKTGWLKNTFGESLEEGFNPAKFASKADYFEKPANARAAKAILGKDFGTFKMLLNAMNEMSRAQSGFVGSLVLRSKEAGAASAVAQGAVGGASAMASLPAAGAVFFGPMLLAHMASNPASVRALLEGSKKVSVAAAAGKTKAASTLMNQTYEKVMSTFSEEEQADIRNEIRGGTP